MNTMTKTLSAGSGSSAAAVPKVRVRDRILDTARGLFYRYGLRAVGVEAIATEAGTNKMSFYRCFPSKDELIAEYLREQGRGYWDWWDAAIAPHAGDARRQLEALFDNYMTLTCKDGSRGCSFGNAVVELPEGDHPGRRVIEQHKAEMRGRLRTLSSEAGATDPEALGDTLMLLMEGGYLTRLSFCSQGPISVAGKAVRTLLDAHIPAVASTARTVRAASSKRSKA
ncbi:TetR/AcrR family transcriptional regulator [Nevskia ramosa]|uniref:TetR/AcrR family transcriptional regulator n=1 Tax=Nevskia ramosa TaxID=64002 RepID=UPI000415A490|nr:TetR/AcrR family transcriptional regulator [Nevskia ramosa]